MRTIFFTVLLILSFRLAAQTCDCEKELRYIQGVIETNFAGFQDNIARITPAAYNQKIKQLIKLSRDRYASDNCLLIIEKYLDQFNSHHIGFKSAFNAMVTDTDFVNHRPLFPISEKKLQQIRNSDSWEGIYYFTHDSSYKVAVIKDKTPLHDYVGVLLESKIPTWKKGMIKFEGKLVNDSLMTGLLYMRNHRPKLEGFNLWNNNEMVGGDWRREGTQKHPLTYPPYHPSPSVDFKKLSDDICYVKIESFESENRQVLDSVLNANEKILTTSPYLILDLRNNGGGSDYTWQPLLPYLFTSPIKTVGVNVLVTSDNIKGWEKYLDDKDLSEQSKQEIHETVSSMQKSKGQWLNIANDDIDSSYKPKQFPRRIAIVVNRYCGSSTEQFLLAAKQSSKVMLMGENTIGNLDYSNVVQIPFSCFPYILLYPTTRSRRLDIGQGIDGKGISPDYYLKPDMDWIKQAEEILQK